VNVVFFAIVAIAFLVSAGRQLVWVAPSPDAVSPMNALTASVAESAGNAVTLAIGLVGMMTLFLGLMKVVEAGGMLKILSKAMRPVMVRLFPDVPPDHPAMGAMILTMGANAMGLTNAATPFGIRAIQALDTLNPRKGTATNAMVLFLAINTSAVTLLPTGVIATRIASGSTDPAGILPTTLFASALATVIGVLAAKLYQRWSPIVVDDDTAGDAAGPAEPSPSLAVDAAMAETTDEAYPVWASMTGFVLVGIGIVLAVIYGREVAPWIIPGLVILFLGFGMARGVRVYEVLVDGGREGFQVAVRIIPYIVAILVAVGMFRASGALEMLVGTVGPVTSLVGMPAEALPMALLRPLSGQGAFGVMVAIIQDPAIGPDSYTGYLVSTMQGATDTTFYILAVYFGAVQVRRMRHALAAGLSADVAGMAGAIIACSYLYG